MARISVDTAQTLNDMNGGKYYNIYYDNGATRGMGSISKRFRRENTGFYSSSTSYGNTIEMCLDSSKHNSLEQTGYIVLGNAWTISNVIKGVGRCFMPESNQHDMIYSACYEFNTRFKICASNLKYGLPKNTAIRYYPNKKNPRTVDVYGFNMEKLIAQKRILGTFSYAFKTDALNEVSNTIAAYLGKKETIYMDENGGLRYFSNHSLAVPPELTDETSFQNNREHNTAFRRSLANFMYFGVNERKTIFEANENAESIWLQQQLKTNHMYELKDVIENTYTEEKLFQPLLEKYFENVVVVEDSIITFEYKGTKYTLNGDTIYDEKNEEVLGIQLEDESIFTFNYEKYIAYALKDNAEVKDYIARFKEYLKNPQKFDFNEKYYKLGWVNAEVDVEIGEGQYLKCHKSTQQNLRDSKIYDYYSNYHLPNYNAEIDYFQYFAGKYNSANLFPLSQLISINTSYNNKKELVLRNEKLTQSADDFDNTSYENALFTPILIKNYVYATYDTANKKLVKH